MTAAYQTMAQYLDKVNLVELSLQVFFTQTSWFLMPYYRKTVKRKMFEYMRYVQTHVSE